MTFVDVLKKYQFMPNVQVKYHDINKQLTGGFWWRLNGHFPHYCRKYPPKCICYNYFTVEKYGKAYLICNCYHPGINQAMINEKEQQEYCDAVSCSAWNDLEAYNQDFGKQYNMFGGMD